MPINEFPRKPAPEPPADPRNKLGQDLHAAWTNPKLYEIPRNGVPQQNMSDWWDEHWLSKRFYDYYIPSDYPLPAPQGWVYTTTNTANLKKKEPVTTKREEILQEAVKLITNDRQEQYGPPEENFQNIADVWNVRFKNKLSEPFTAADIAAAMALLKIVRDIAGYKEDSAVDAAAYIALYAELSEKEQKA